MQQLSNNARAFSYSVAALVGVPLLALVWAYWTTLGGVARDWSKPDNSHGYIVPLFAAALLWMRRGRFKLEEMKPNWIGLPLILLALALRLYGAHRHYVWFDQISFIPCLVGLTLLLGGWAAWRWAWPALLFLCFMVPLPYRAAVFLSGPLQKLATVLSTFVLQTFGLPALSEGNVILIDEARIGIVEACSGLRMLVVFFALGTGLALVVRRPLIDKCILVFSAIPIAIISNVIRVTVTGFLYVTVENGEVAKVFFHDVAGWLMMPLALFLMWVELKILAKLLIEVPTAGGAALPAKVKRVAANPVRSRRRERAMPASRRRQRAEAKNQDDSENVTVPSETPTV